MTIAEVVQRVSDSSVLSDFMVASMEMHMIGAMYAPTDRLTLMTMVPLRNYWMDHVNRMGNRFRTESRGVGDTRFGALYRLFEWERHSVHMNLGMRFPTGSIDQTDTTPTGQGTVLPYPMQLGSGTFDLIPGMTYLGQSEDWSWGGQGIVTSHLGRNNQDYRLGDRLDLTGWLARKWTKGLSTSLRLTGSLWDNVQGSDSRQNPGMVPTADSRLRSGDRIDLSYGLNLMLPDGGLKGLEGRTPTGYRTVYASVPASRWTPVGSRLVSHGGVAVAWFLRIRP